MMFISSLAWPLRLDRGFLGTQLSILYAVIY